MQYCSLQTGHPSLQVIELGLTLRFVPRCDTPGRGGGTSDGRGYSSLVPKVGAPFPVGIYVWFVGWLIFLWNMDHGIWNMKFLVGWLLEHGFEIWFWNMILEHGIWFWNVIFEYGI